jgi:hypothetical protein
VAELPRLAARWRGSRGAAQLEVRGSVAPTFGGVRSFPLAADGSIVRPEALPTEHLRYGYHFAAGWAAEPSLAARLGPLGLELWGRADSLWAVLRPDADVARRPSADLHDQWLEGRATLSVRPRGGLELRGGWEWRGRRGAVEGISRRAEEQAWSLAVAFGR